MAPRDFAHLLTIVAAAGRSSSSLTGPATGLFRDGQDRLLNDIGEFAVKDLIQVVKSMATFKVANVALLQHMGREKLHGDIVNWPAKQVSELCQAYGDLGWRHDTVFRDTTTAILKENEILQRARALDRAKGMALEYSISDVARTMRTMLELKLNRGNTSWCKWADNYELLLEILQRRTEEQCGELNARPLASVAFVLGRARRGTLELCKMMLDRMLEILGDITTRAASSVDAPQYHLAEFLHGLSMMGPERRKNLDAFSLMKWICEHVHTLPLSDLISINRQLVSLGCHDKEYLELFIPWLCDRIDSFTKSDVMEVTHTYNGARFRDDDMGRHFFWALGKQYQKLQVENLKTVQYRRIG